MTAIVAKRITAVLLVEQIEPCLSFWVDSLGFTAAVAVPDGDRLAFVSLQKGSTEVMYQTYDSVQRDNARVAQEARGSSTLLYVEVDDLDAVIAALSGADVFMPVRTAFYGAREIGLRDPAGHLVTFAQFLAPQ